MISCNIMYCILRKQENLHQKESKSCRCSIRFSPSYPQLKWVPRPFWRPLQPRLLSCTLEYAGWCKRPHPTEHLHCWEAQEGWLLTLQVQNWEKSRKTDILNQCSSDSTFNTIFFLMLRKTVRKW